MLSADKNITVVRYTKGSVRPSAYQIPSTAIVELSPRSGVAFSCTIYSNPGGTLAFYTSTFSARAEYAASIFTFAVDSIPCFALTLHARTCVTEAGCADTFFTSAVNPMPCCARSNYTCSTITFTVHSPTGIGVMFALDRWLARI
jgi:hypothetical protein